MRLLRPSTKRIAFILLIAVAIAASVYAMFAVPLGLNEARLQFDARNNERKLNRLTILTGRHNAATAYPDGDALTGHASPAQVTYSVNDSVRNLVREVSANLSRQGYKVSSPYRADENGSTTVQRIEQRATKDKDTLFITYTLKAVYDCVPVFTSFDNPEGVCPSSVVSDAHLLNRQANQVSADLN